MHPYSRQTSFRNEQMLTRSTSTWLDNQKKDHIVAKGPKKRNRSKQLQTNYLLTNDVDNINNRDKEIDLLVANKLQIVRWRTERMLQRIQRHSRVTLLRSTHPKWEQVETEKPSYGLDWLQKGTWYCSAKLDNKQPQNVQNIW